MTITHGYYFDHERCKPMFLDDTWEYHTTHKKWRYRSLGSDEAVQALPRAICVGRFAFVSMFGGTDGGLRVNKGENFIFGPRAGVQRFVALATQRRVGAVGEAPRRLGRDL